MRDYLDLGYLAAVGLAGALARSLRRGLPEGWRLRLEAAAPPLPAGWIWLHAVSVGELLLAEGILGRLKAEGHRVHVTTGTPAGLALLDRRLAAWGGAAAGLSGGPFPLDDPAGLEPFLLTPPAAFVALETELWPNLLRALEERDIPRVIVNGRLTERSLSRGGPFLRRAASRLSLVCARDAASAEAFRRLGAPRVHLGGNLKADLPPPRPLHEGWAVLRAAWAGAPVLVAGNTVEGEERLVLQAWRRARERRPDLKLILAPRQPRRFDEVAGLFAAEGLAFRRASQPWLEEAAAWAATPVLLLDTLGELPGAYALGSLALVGGGWCWHGGHNPLEPVRWGIPTLLGPGCDNFEDLALPLEEAGQVERVEAEALAAHVTDLAAGLPAGGTAPQPPPLPEALRGSLDRTWSALKTCLPPPRYDQQPIPHGEE